MREFVPLPPHRDQARLTPDGRVHLTAGPIPPLERGDLLFQLLGAGIAPGEDPAGTTESPVPMAVPVGEISAVGDGVGGFSPLDRALLLGPPGRPALPLSEGLASFLHVPAARRAQGGVLKIPDGMSPEDATLIPATALAHRILREARIPAGGRLLVIGLGLVGQILILLARHQRVERIVAADPSPTLRRKAEYSGATAVVRLFEEDLRQAVLAERGGANAVVALLPHLDPVIEALGVLAPGGALLVATRFPETASLGIRLDPLRRGGIRIGGVSGHEERDLRAALQTVRHGTVNAENLVSRRIPWSELDGLELSPDAWAQGNQIVVHGPEGLLGPGIE